MIKTIKELFSWLLGVLSVFDVSKYIDAIKEPIKEYLGWLNWLVPFGTILKIYTVWLSCVGAFFVFIIMKPIVMNLIKKVIFAKSE